MTDVIEIVPLWSPTICPECRDGRHWNHQRADQSPPKYGPPVPVGACRSVSNGEVTCICEWRSDGMRPH